MSNNLATAIASGTATITATVCGLSDTVTATSASCSMLSVDASPATQTLGVGGSVQLTARATYSCGDKADITSSASWSSSDPAVATVSNAPGSEGQVTAVGPGSATVTATDLSTLLADSVAITVTSATLQSLAILPNTPQSMAKGEKQPFIAVASYSDGGQHDATLQVSWSATPPGILTFDTYVAQGLAVGAASVSASLAGVTSNTVPVTVTPAVLASLAIAPAGTQVLKVGDSIPFAVTATYSDETTQDVSVQASWSASPAGVLTFSGSTATAMALGMAAVSAALSGVSADPVTVLVAPPGAPCVK
jgi:hypothetical protein